MNPDPPSHDDMQDVKLQELLRRTEPDRRDSGTSVELLERAMERALRRVLNDSELREAYWAAGYKEFEKHAGSAAAQWVGRKVIHILLAALLAGSLTWAVVTGRIK